MRNSARWLQSICLAVLCAGALASSAAHADPVIDGFNKDRGPLLSLAIIYGSGFGDAQGSSYVLFGGRGVPILGWSNNVIYFIVNPMAYDPQPLALDTSYAVQVVKQPENKTSNARNFTLTSEAPAVNPPGSALAAPSEQPTITGFQAPQFCQGNVMAIYGAGFGSSAASGYVSVTVPLLDALGTPFTQEYVVPVLLWSENAIDILLHLPAGAQLGAYSVTVHRTNGKSASRSFPVVACP